MAAEGTRTAKVVVRACIYPATRYMQDSPVQRGMVKHLCHWPWSRRSGGIYFWNDASILGMRKML